jgi:hypothetical protein
LEFPVLGGFGIFGKQLSKKQADYHKQIQTYFKKKMITLAMCPDAL